MSCTRITRSAAAKATAPTIQAPKITQKKKEKKAKPVEAPAVTKATKVVVDSKKAQAQVSNTSSEESPIQKQTSSRRPLMKKEILKDDKTMPSTSTRVTRSTSTPPAASTVTPQKIPKKVQLPKTPIVAVQSTVTRTELNSFTPVMDKRKAAAKDTMSFPGRLNWKLQRYGMPVTSTPKVVAKKTVTKTDLETCFGFEESDDDENYSALISPIIATSKTPKLVNNEKSKPAKRDDVQVLQVNNSKEPSSEISPLKNVNSCVKENAVNEVNQQEKATAKKVKEKRAYTRKPKNTHPNKEKAPIRSNKKKNVPKARSSEMYDLGEVASSQQLEVDVSSESSVPELDKEVFSKETSADAGFTALLARYGKSDDHELQFHIDPAQIKKTYTSRKREIGPIPFLPQKTKKPRTTIPRKKNKNTKQADSDREHEEEKVDSETKKWVEQKNKEFDDVDHQPLMLLQ